MYTPAMTLLPLLVLAATASAASRNVTVTVTDGKEAWSHTESVRVGSASNSVTPLQGKRLLLNVVASAKGKGVGLQYQVELSPAKTGKTAKTFHVQGELTLRPGVAVRSAVCGPWSLTLAVDGEDVEAGDDFGAADGNLRVTAEFSRGKYKTACSAVLQGGTQGNVVEGGSGGGKKYGTILNMLPVQAASGAAVSIQFERSGPDGPTVQLQKDVSLTFGKRQAVTKSPYRFSLLAEGRPRLTRAR